MRNWRGRLEEERWGIGRSGEREEGEGAERGTAAGSCLHSSDMKSWGKHWL